MNKEADLKRWFKEKWVDISKKDESGKHPECGRSDADEGSYPKCRPSKKISKETPTTSKSLSKRDKKKAVSIKRRKERSSPSESAGGSARKPKYTKLSGENMSRMISKRASEKYHEDEKLYMIKKNLSTMMKETRHMYKIIEEGDDVPEWCQEKLAVAANMIDTVFEYIVYDMRDMESGESSESSEHEEDCDCDKCSDMY
jgi:hypothetical protein